MRRRTIGATLTTVGVLVLLFEPVGESPAARTLDFAVSKRTACFS